MLAAYGQSKLALVMFTADFAGRQAGAGVIANSVHPGFVGSNFGIQAGGFGALLGPPPMPFLSAPRQGAKTTIPVARPPDLSRRTGRSSPHSTPLPHHHFL